MSRVTYPPSLGVSDGPAYDPTDRPFVPAAGGGGVTTLIYDAFTDTASTNLTAHTPDEVGAGVSSNWVLWGAGSAWTIDTDGVGALCTNTGYNGAYVDVGVAEHVIRARRVGWNSGIVTRFIDASNHWLVYVDSGGVKIYENGSTLRASSVASFTSGVNLTITTTSTQISVLAQQGSTSETVSYSSTTHNTGTKVGLGQAGTVVDDILDFRCIDSTDAADLPADAVTLLVSRFTVGSDTALASYTPDTDAVGSGYTVSAGTWTVQAATNDLQTPASAFPNTRYATIDPASHGTYPLLITSAKCVGSGDRLQLNVRWQDTNNRFGINRQASSLDIFEITGGSAFVRATTSVSAPNGTDSAHISDDEIILRAGEGGTDLISYATTTNNTVKVTGLGCYNVTENVDDHIVVGGTTDPADLP